MNGELAQLVALATHTRAYLRSNESIEPFLNNSTCSYCRDIKFYELRRWFGKWKDRKCIGGPDDWMSFLRSHEYKYCRIWHQPSGETQFTDRITAGFIGGGGQWLIETSNATQSNHWQAAWQVGDADAPNEKVWRVKYGRISQQKLSKPLCYEAEDLNTRLEQLSDCLERVHQFAVGQSLADWSICFRAGLDAAKSDTPLLNSSFRDLVPDNVVCLAGKRILGAACHAWVFGGMGSWNDLSFEGDVQNEYTSLSDELFELLNVCVQDAVNVDSE